MVELNAFMIKLNGGIGYVVQASCKDSIALILKMEKSNIITLEKPNKQSKYLYTNQLIEVQQIDNNSSLQDQSWFLKEK